MHRDVTGPALLACRKEHSPFLILLCPKLLFLAEQTNAAKTILQMHHITVMVSAFVEQDLLNGDYLGFQKGIQPDQDTVCKIWFVRYKGD